MNNSAEINESEDKDPNFEVPVKKLDEDEENMTISRSSESQVLTEDELSGTDEDISYAKESEDDSKEDINLEDETFDIENDKKLAEEKRAKKPILNPFADIRGYPYKLNWVFGHNPRVPPVNVSTSWRKVVFFVSGAIGIRYDCARTTQAMLVGHKNDIVCIATTPDKRFIVTADSGPNNAVIIWNTHTGLIYHVINNYFTEEGVVCITFDTDMNFMLTLSANKPQELTLWNWKHFKSTPDYTFQFEKEEEFQHYATFHLKHSFHFASCSKKNVYFFKKEDETILSASLDLSSLYDESTCSHAGDFTQTTFTLTSTRAITGTTRGMVVLWGRSIFAKEKPARTSHEWFFMEPAQRVCIMMLQVMPNRCGVTCLTVSLTYIVAGTGAGDICYYDDHFNNLWSLSTKEGPVSKVCYSFMTDQSDEAEEKFMSQKSKRKWAALHVEARDLMVFTSHGFGGFVAAATGTLEDVLTGTSHLVKSLAVNPERSILYTGDYDGGLVRWHYDTKEFLGRGCYQASCVEIEFVTIDPTGIYIGCVMTSGSIAIFETSQFEGTPSFATDRTRDKPSMIRFSPDPQFLLVTDTARYVSLYRLFVLIPPMMYMLLKKEEDIPCEEPNWRYGGKTRQHEGRIVDCLFNEPAKNEALFFFTLGDDRTIVIYDISNSKGQDIMVIGRITLEMHPVPVCMTWYPLYDLRTLIGVVSNDRRMRIYNYESGKVAKMILLPLYEEQIKSISFHKKIMNLERNTEVAGNATRNKNQAHEADGIRIEESIPYFAFRTDRTIGMIKYPMDGNPNANLAMQVHPSGVSTMVTNKDNTYLFTTGVGDCSVYMYEIDIQSVLDVAREGGEGVDAFLPLFPSTEDPQEMKQRLVYSVYALELEKKMLNLGSNENTLLKGEIPIEYLHYVLAAMGFYTTPQELESMLVDLNVDNQFLYEGKKTTVDCLDIIKLYVNYRPVQPVGMEAVCKAFRDVLATEDDPEEVPRPRLMEILKSRGDKLDEDELKEIIECLRNTKPVTSMEDYDISGCLSDSETSDAEAEEEETTRVESEEHGSNVATVDDESTTTTVSTTVHDMLPEVIDENVLIRKIFQIDTSQEDLSAYVLKKEDKKAKLVPYTPSVDDFVREIEKQNMLKQFLR